MTQHRTARLKSQNQPGGKGSGICFGQITCAVENVLINSISTYFYFMLLEKGRF